MWAGKNSFSTYVCYTLDSLIWTELYTELDFCELSLRILARYQYSGNWRLFVWPRRSVDCSQHATTLWFPNHNLPPIWGGAKDPILRNQVRKKLSFFPFFHSFSDRRTSFAWYSFIHSASTTRLHLGMTRFYSCITFRVNLVIKSCLIITICNE